MASKPTKRERKDEAKKRRLEEMRRRQRRARMRKVYTYSVFGLILAVIAGAVLFTRAKNASARNELVKVAARGGCGVPQGWPIEGNNHISPQQRATYKTDPPTSGAHWAGGQPPAPAPTGVYTQPALQDEQTVHNLEHGHIVISYQQGSLSAAQVTALGQVVRTNPQWILLQPRANKNTKVAFTAWGVKQRCDNPKDGIDKVAAEFVKRFRNKGRESAAGQPIFQDEPQTPPASSPPPTSAATPTGASSPS